MTVAEMQARIGEIRSLLGVHGAVRAAPLPSPATTFAAALAAATPSAPSGGSATGERAVALAKEHLGVPYVWGGSTPAGFDCSGLVQHTFERLGIDLPRVSRDQASAGSAVANLSEARPGDLVFYGRPVDHVGIYAGNGEMVVAPRRGDVVKVQKVDVDRITHIRRVIPDAVAPAAARPQAVPGDVPYADLFAAAGARHGVSSTLLASVARAESSFNPNARSQAGALGLMQLMPGTARSLGVDPLDPRQAVDGAARLLASHLRQFGSVELALAAYNAGPGAVTRHRGVPPYRETQTYIRRVLAGIGGS